MQGLGRVIRAVAVAAITATVLTACGPGGNTGSDTMTAREMMTVDVTLRQPAGPDSGEYPAPEDSAPIATPLETPSDSTTSGVATIAPEKAMRVPPFDEPKRFKEFSRQGAANVVAYYTYAAYYGLVAGKTDYMRKVFSPECSKCNEMASWVEKFVGENQRVETGVPRTTIIDVYSEKSSGKFFFWVVAENLEPPIIGYDAQSSMTGYDPASTSKSLYRVEFIEGKNVITGIFKVPARYE